MYIHNTDFHMEQHFHFGVYLLMNYKEFQPYKVIVHTKNILSLLLFSCEKCKIGGEKI